MAHFRPLKVRAIRAGFFSALFAPSLAQAALPANELWREDLVNNAVGYGKNATGGKGGTLCTVTNLNDSGPNSLRDCLTRSGPQWIIFSVSGTINLTSQIIIYPPTNGADKTIDGRGQNIVLSGGGGLLLSFAQNIIIHNITLRNLAEINMLGGSANIWIDHITCSTLPYDEGGDECIDVGSAGGGNWDACTAITVSWSRFQEPEGSGVMLIAHNSAAVEMEATTLTAHHNWFEKTDIRHPYFRHAKVHFFNNYYDQVEIGAQAALGARFYAENEIYEGQPGGNGGYPRVHADPFGPTGTGTGTEGPSANVKVLNPWLVTGVETYQERNASTIFNPASDYTYTAETANAALRTSIMNGAGWQNVAAPTTPTVSLERSPASITPGQSSILTWSSTNAPSCTASGGWTGAKATHGTQSVSPAATTTYTLTCSGPGGSANQSVTITVGPPSLGPVAWYKLDETTGTTAADSAGTNPATLANGPVWTTGKINNALSFDGVDDDASAESLGSGLFAWDTTVAAWLNSNVVTGNDWRGAIVQGTYTAGFWWLGFYNGTWQFYGSFIGTIETLELISPPITANTWYHVAIVRNSSNTLMYVNGVQVASGPPTTRGTTGKLSLGTTGPGTWENFDGKIDDVRIYNRALSASEVQALHAAGGSPPDTTPPSKTQGLRFK